MYPIFSTLRQLIRTSVVVRKLSDLDMFDEVRIVRTPKGLVSTVKYHYCGVTTRNSLDAANRIADATKRMRKKKYVKCHCRFESTGTRPKTRSEKSVSKIYEQRNDRGAVRKVSGNY